jgi:transcriptional regulator with GAF, ATPase, and Fis domain
MIRNDPRVVQGNDDPLDPGRIPEFTDIITADPHLTEILSCLPIYAESDLPILLTGEPGTGKELVAMAIFALGPARRRTCQSLNCAALTESLASSELFGHVRGAFTGASHARPGKFRLAHGGSLFLDEVGELPPAIQPKLLRAVEQGEIEPVGGDTPVKVDVRLVAASNQDLLGLIAQGRFRQDLYDRLAVLAIHLPPLRERPEDILLLADYFARETARRYARDQFVQFSGAARRRLQKQAWPGNVRELRNVVTRAVLFSAGSLIEAEDLVFTPYPSGAMLSNQAMGEGMGFRPSAVQLKELLDSAGGNVSALSRRLQVCSKTIYRWARSYHIDLMGIRGAAAI